MATKKAQPSKTYLGNPSLKGVGVEIEWTTEMIQEYARCANDPVYFVRNYMHIVHLDHGIIKFDLYDYQEELLYTYTNERRVIVLSSRQSGKSITSIGFFLHYTLFNSHKTIAILANKGDSARGLLGRYKLAYEMLPKFLQQGVVEWNKGNIKLENGCEILAGSTSNSAVRSRSINILFLDEFAFVEPNMADDFFKSTYPTISSGTTTKIIIVSTANGMNHYFKMWDDAYSSSIEEDPEKKKSNFVPVRIDWFQVPGRNEKWKEETILATSQEQFDQEFGNEFIGSAGTLISPNKLKTLTWQNPIRTMEGITVYNEPEEGRKYSMTFDASEGLGLDYACLNVFDITEMPYKQVAVFRSNIIDVHLQPDIIYKMGHYFNEAYVLIELNEHGSIVADILYQDLEYENLMFVTQTGNKGQILGGGFGGRSQTGIKQSKQTKKIGCSVLKTLIENDQLTLQDFATVSELTSFVRVKNSYEAEEGYNDDTTMTLVMFAWITKQQYFKDDMQQDIRTKLHDEHVEHIISNLAPVGHFSNGLEYAESSNGLKNGMVWNNRM